MTKDVSIDDPFFGPFLKVDRAYQHIAELDGAFKVFLDKHEKVISGKPNDDPGEDVVLGGGFPIHTPTILGDVVHNLRASLDHAYCLLIEANGQAVDDATYFPFVKDGKGLEGTIRGNKKPKPVPSDKVIGCIIDDIQPYEGGKLGLYGVHRLDRTDKHRVLIPATPKMEIGVIEGRNGQPFRWEGGTFVTEHGKPHTAGFMSFGPGAVLKDTGQKKTTLDVTFGKGQPFEDESILPKLREMAGIVTSALELLAATK